MNVLFRKPPWYAAGLAFECTQCGRCCCGPEEGYVWLTESEIGAIAETLGISPAETRQQYVRKVRRRLSLKERPGNKDCIFLEPDGASRGRCRIYLARPTQCRTWPFWPRNLADPESWAMAQLRCKGVNRGAIHCFEEIEAKRNATRE